MQKLVDKKTEFLQNKLLSSKEFRKVEYNFENPLDLIKSELQARAITNKEVAIKLGLSESHVSKLLKGERVTRDNVLKLCILLELSLEQTNQVLKYLSMHPLYVKDGRDAVIIHGLSYQKTIDEINQTLAENKIKQI